MHRRRSGGSEKLPITSGLSSSVKKSCLMFNVIYMKSIGDVDLKLRLAKDRLETVAQAWDCAKASALHCLLSRGLMLLFGVFVVV